MTNRLVCSRNRTHLDEMQRDMTLYLGKVMRIPLSVNRVEELLVSGVFQMIWNL